MRRRNEENYTQTGGKEKKKSKKISNIISSIVLVLAILCFIGSVGYLIKYFYTNYKAESKINKLEEKIQVDTVETVIETDESGEEVVIDGRYLELYRENSDFLGWVAVDGTPLSYPVMYTPEDPEYYLHRNFEKAYEYSGLPFLDARCSITEPSQNLIIYGHNMKSQTMFSTLLKYKDRAYYEEHPMIRFDTLYEQAEYEIVYVFLAKAYAEGEEGFRYYDFIDTTDEQEFEETIAEIEKLSLYDTGVEVTMEDKFITLSTCEYSQENGRMAVLARKIEK